MSQNLPMNNNLISLAELLAEAENLTAYVRALVRAENKRVHEARMTGKHVSDCGSRDEADLVQVDLYKEWPAKRLDALLAALKARAQATTQQEER